MKRLLIILFLVLFCPVWCNAAWEDGETRDKYCTITIDHTKVDEALSDFPVLLTEADFPANMKDSDETSDCAQNGGGDIRFSSTDPSSSITQIACEVVSFVTNSDPTLATAEVWVPISSLSSVSDTVIYCVWHTSGTSSQPVVDSVYGAENIWDADFKMVQHMVDNTTSTIIDSTSNANNGAKKAANEPVEAEGQIGKAQDFDGSNDYVDCGNDSSLGITDAITLEAWVKPDTLGDRIYAIGIKGTDSTNRAYYMWIDRDRDFDRVVSFQLYNNSDTKYGWYGTNIISTNVGHHVAAVLNLDNSVSLFLDGAEEAISYADPGDFSGSIRTNIESFYIGNYQGYESYFNGTIDEVRISSIARSAAWIKASYYSQSDTLVSCGSIQTVGAGAAAWSPIIIELF